MFDFQIVVAYDVSIPSVEEINAQRLRSHFEFFSVSDHYFPIFYIFLASLGSFLLAFL